MTDYGSVRDEMRLLWLGHRNWLERAEGREFKATPEEITRKKQIKGALAIVGTDLNVIADNAASFEEWKLSVQHRAA